ncbi:hypothetical protein IM40_03650 [Candidatus Paracaedimonas acanthamoebae]|nr:hypothetical protein IM40_03650 [Candidatus Paracaedimonas acanthamoebae]
MLSQKKFNSLLKQVQTCKLCASTFPHEPRPVIRGLPSARLLIIGQAPGTRVQETGMSFNDASGDRLRQWLNIDRDTFYDEAKIAIMPMGLCYPGQNSKGADLPPSPACAPKWHHLFLNFMPQIKLTLLVGMYAQRYYLRPYKKLSSTNIIRSWKECLPNFFPLPHPSWRNNSWLKKNPWFTQDVLPALQRRVQECLV